MSYKILMLGGRRAGKSTILATVLYELQHSHFNGCTFRDSTNYPIFVFDKNDGLEKPIPSLEEKRIEIHGYLNKRIKYGPNSKFIVDMTPGINKCEYLIQSSIGRLDFTFVDVPGEWMETSHPEFAELKKEISDTDVFIIAIDTPYLMKKDDNNKNNYDDNVNDIYNRIAEIRNALGKILIDEQGLDKKLFLFCPVKCEKWVNAGEINEVVSRIKQSYNGIIDDWIGRDVDMWILPIQTAGGIESYKLLPAMKAYNNAQQAVGEKCSVEGGLVIYPMGNTVRQNNVYRIEEDAAQIVKNTDIPYSWYKINEKKQFMPKDCEQVMYRIFKFLVEKETLIMESKKTEYESLGFLKRLWRRKPPFGEYLPKYKSLINELILGNKIKENVDGFVQINKQ